MANVPDSQLQLDLGPIAPQRTPADRHQLIIKRVADMTDDEVTRCCALTLPHGLMRHKLIELRTIKDPRAQVIMVNDPDAPQLWGWLLLQHRDTGFGRQSPLAYMFVAPIVRRRGLGRVLLEAALTGTGSLEVCPWDSNSRGFYSAVREQGLDDQLVNARGYG